MAECKMLLIGESNIEINEHKLILVFLNHSQENYSHHAGFLDYQELDGHLHLEINSDWVVRWTSYPQHPNLNFWTGHLVTSYLSD